jgi:hypothetical protein
LTDGYVKSLTDAVGQYVTYQAALNVLEDKTPLYLAVPLAAYEGILSELIGYELIRQLHIKIVLFDPEREEIARWIP